MKPQLVINSTTGMQYVLHRGLLAAFFIPVPFFRYPDTNTHCSYLFYTFSIYISHISSLKEGFKIDWGFQLFPYPNGACSVYFRML